MQRQAEDMANSSHPLMKMLKRKFDTCYELRLGVNNVDTFVDNVDNFPFFCMDNLQVFLADICKYFPQLHPIHKK